MSTAASRTATAAWGPLSAKERRVLGVLIEKAKTTPDAYPLSLNAIRTGCNQKSNRAPVMHLAEDDVHDTLDRLREKGAALEVQGDGRVAKYRHMGYEWLGVDKREIAVIAELLLRGAQTVGELRGRAARMEAIADVAELRPVLDSLKAKGLVALSHEGRGQIVSHTLDDSEDRTEIPTESRPSGDVRDPAAEVAKSGATGAARLPPSNPESNDLRHDLAEIKAQIAELRADVEDMKELFGRSIDELQSFKNELGG